MVSSIFLYRVQRGSDRHGWGFRNAGILEVERVPLVLSIYIRLSKISVQAAMWPTANVQLVSRIRYN
jgi:hypothetical protein